MKTSNLITAIYIGMTTLQIANANDRLVYNNARELSEQINKETIFEVYNTASHDVDNKLSTVEKAEDKKKYYKNEDMRSLKEKDATRHKSQRANMNTSLKDKWWLCLSGSDVF